MRRVLAILSVVSLSGACGAPPAAVGPSASSPSVDVLDFLIGESSLWPRVGNHSQNQVVDYARQEVCWVKYANPRMFECWRWDDAFVYHVVDHGIDGNTGESYQFSDGRWLPRRLGAAWSLDLRENRIVWFDPNCRMAAPRTFPYRQRAWVEPELDAGGDLGVRAVLVLEYQPYDPTGRAGEVERFLFARGAGWYGWDRGAVRDRFNRVGGPNRPVARDAACGGL